MKNNDGSCGQLNADVLGCDDMVMLNGTVTNCMMHEHARAVFAWTALPGTHFSQMPPWSWRILMSSPFWYLPLASFAVMAASNAARMSLSS